MVLSAKNNSSAVEPVGPGFLRCDVACDVAENARRFVFTVLDEQREEEYVPGRYLILEYAGATGQVRTACYSIVACPTRWQVEIIVQRVPSKGLSETMFNHLMVGALVRCVGVAGDITAQQLSGLDSVALLAGGIGFTLPWALIREFRQWARQGRRVPRITLLLCTPSLEAVPCFAELMTLELAERWFTLRIHVTRQSLYQDNGCLWRGRPNQGVLDALEGSQGIVICGSQAFAVEIHRAMQVRHGGAQYFIEAFSSADSPLPAKQADTGTVRLKIPASGVEFEAVHSLTLLAQLESQGLKVRSQCRAGICGACKIKVLKGECRSEADFALSVQERAAGYALACCSYPVGDELTLCLRTS
ncbi:2Fe-2S iron-sulfur cluster-binding protein [Pseudomonas sp. CFBP 8758]|uniref:2Fe-2S iron-sulfur cluster-binding protein n=1 Tax=Pseudomonas sp. CFBP 8758 TaxID=2775286 RepID=UPI001FCFE561|nr:2Fe-2S iron-sulfur cluster-binding protein [Pseudomonas sp. CFBP 8758]